MSQTPHECHFVEIDPFPQIDQIPAERESWNYLQKRNLLHALFEEEAYLLYHEFSDFVKKKGIELQQAPEEYRAILIIGATARSALYTNLTLSQRYVTISEGGNSNDSDPAWQIYPLYSNPAYSPSLTIAHTSLRDKVVQIHEKCQHAPKQVLNDLLRQ